MIADQTGRIVFGGNGPALHFLHANGFPPQTYTPLLTNLTEHYHVSAMETRSMQADQPHTQLTSWWQVSADLIAFIEANYTAPIIGMGHSIGAVVTLHAAVQRPDLFTKLVLLDPVIIPPFYSFMWGIVAALGLGHKHPLHTSAMRRRAEYNSKQQMYAGFRRAGVFKKISDANLQHYIDAIAIPLANGKVGLRITKEWEAQIYKTMPGRIWRHIRQLKTPTALIYADKSDTVLPNSVKAMRRYAPQVQLHCVENATHLVPLEYPDLVSKLSLDFLASNVHHA